MLLEQSSHSRIASLKYRLTSLISLGTRAKTCKSCQNDAEMFKSCRSSSKLCERMCAFCLGSKERISQCSFVSDMYKLRTKESKVIEQSEKAKIGAQFLHEKGNNDGGMGDTPAPHVCDHSNRKAEASKEDIECFSSNSSSYHLPILALSYISLLFVRLFRRYS